MTLSTFSALDRPWTQDQDENEGFDPPHLLLVYEVRPPDGDFDSGDLACELFHTALCRVSLCAGWPSETLLVEEWSCRTGWQMNDGDLAFTLRYSGTPITEAGVYRVQGWFSRSYVWDAWAYEYDGGIGVLDRLGDIPAEWADRYDGWLER